MLLQLLINQQRRHNMFALVSPLAVSVPPDAERAGNMTSVHTEGSYKSEFPVSVLASGGVALVTVD